MLLTFVLQMAQSAPGDEADRGIVRALADFIDSPAPYSPFAEYLLLLFVLWFIARRQNRRQSFDNQAQDVLDEKFAQGELSQKAYEKFRQDVSLRPKR
jgi:hypothetical protein